jgi:hypothetical protein
MTNQETKLKIHTLSSWIKGKQNTWGSTMTAIQITFVDPSPISDAFYHPQITTSIIMIELLNL